MNNQNLKTAILDEIRLSEVNRAQKIWLFFGPLSLISTVGLVVYWSNLIITLRDSNFLKILELFFSDSDIMFVYWPESLGSIIENLPLIPITIILILLTFTIWSWRLIIINQINKTCLSKNI